MFKGKSKTLVLGFMVLVLTGARTAKVARESAEMLRHPRKDAPVLLTLEKNLVVTASNFPVTGYHKVRAKGKTGWVSAVDLSLGSVPKLKKPEGLKNSQEREVGGELPPLPSQGVDPLIPEDPGGIADF